VTVVVVIAYNFLIYVSSSVLVVNALAFNTKMYREAFYTYVFTSSLYYFLFQKLAFLKQKNTRSDVGGICIVEFMIYVSSSVIYKIAISYFLNNVSRSILTLSFQKFSIHFSVSKTSVFKQKNTRSDGSCSF
jgi:hypothetical protein